MATSTQAVGGLVSGLDWYDIIDKLMAVEARPIETLNTRIAKTKEKKAAYQGISAKLLSLKMDAESLSLDSFFNARNVNSSNSSALSAFVSSSAAIGSYQFSVGQLSSTHQSTSNGFTESSATPGAGSITVELGKNATLRRATPLSFLNSQQGIFHGSIRISDRSGSSQVVDLSTAATVQDVIDKINSANNIQITAKVGDDGDRIVLSDNTGSVAYDFKVEDLDGGTTAEDLGIKTTVSAATITGNDIYNITSSTLLSEVNDGLGIRMANTPDIEFTPLAGPAFSINLDRDIHKTVGDVVTAINDAATAAGASTVASISADGNGITLAGNASLKGINNSSAALDLGLVGPTNRMVAGMNTSFLRNLNGGGYLAADGVTVNGGVDLGQIDLTDRAGNATTVTLAGAATLADAMRAINENGTALLSASINAEGNGLQIKDYSGGINPFVIADNGSTSATNLGIATAGTSASSLNGSDLDVMHVNENTRLANLNGGEGVTTGSIRITTRDGISTEVNLTGDTTMQDVIDDINGIVVGASASINAAGDGLVITDTTGGVGKLTIEEVNNGTTAADLNIKGVASDASPAVIDGSFEYKIDILATDSLDVIAQKIAQSDIPISASVVFDGSYYRLSLASDISGTQGNMVIDSTISNLTFGVTSRAEDAVVLYGGTSSGSSPILITSSDNSISDAIEGLTLNLQQVTTSPVNVSVTKNTKVVTDTVNAFVEHFNSAMASIQEFTDYDTETEEAGILLGDSTIENIRSDLLDLGTSYIDGLPSGKNSLYDIGITLNQEGRLAFDESKLNAMLDTDFDAVKNIFNFSANLALTSNGGFVTASSTAAGFDPQDIANGNTDSESFGAGVNGWQDDTSATYPDYLTINFDDTRMLSRASIWHLNSAAMPVATFGIKSFSVDYLDASSKKWVSFQTIDNNMSPKTSIVFDSGVRASAIRLNITEARNDFARLVEFEAFEDRGIGSLFNNQLNYLTKVNDGAIAQKTATLDEAVKGYEAQIETIGERIEVERSRLINQFTAMEKAIASMQQQSNYMSQQLAGTQWGTG